MERTLMSGTDVSRAVVCGRVLAGDLTLREASARLGVSYRHVKRLVTRFRRAGPRGLVHAGIGRSGNRGLALGETRNRCLAIIARDYTGDVGERFGPRLCSEHLLEDHQLAVHPESLRRWMLSAGLWSRVRKRKPYRRRRERMEHFGEMVQVDGSFHPWLEGRGPVACMVTMIDDATGITLAHFARGETTFSVSEVLELWVRKYGIPRALYADRGGVFEPRQRVGKTQFGRMCEELGIALLKARSPQAKGRVERNHGTHQDRLIKKLRLKQIGSYAAANEFLNTYLPDHNRRFAIAAREESDFHVKLDDVSIDLSAIFSVVKRRKVSEDAVIRYNGRTLQLLRRTRIMPGNEVTVRESRDGGIRIFASGEELRWAELPEKRIANGTKPSPRHPWRQPGYDPQRVAAYKLERRALQSAKDTQIPATIT